MVKWKVKISLNFVAFSEYMLNFTWSCFIDCVSNGCCIGSGRWKSWISDVGTIFTKRSRCRNREKAANSKPIWVKKIFMFWTLVGPTICSPFQSQKCFPMNRKNSQIRILGIAQTVFLQQKCSLCHFDQLHIL